MHELFEGPSLARARLLGLGYARILLVKALELDHLLRELGDPLAVLLAFGPLARPELPVHADHRVLEAEQGVRTFLGGEQLQERVALLLERLTHARLDLLLYRAVALPIEALGDALGELVVARFDRLGEPLAKLRGLTLELGADVVNL